MMNDDKFDYSYSAPTQAERREIESIKKQYLPPTVRENKFERLKKLNSRVTKPPLVIGWVIGVLGVLIMGLGMTLVMEWNMLLWGVLVGILGIAIAAAAYPVYKLLLKRNKRKYGNEILALSDELLNQEKCD